jgi:hypothetical protein
MSKNLLLVCLALFAFTGAYAQKWSSSVAVVVDLTTYNKTTNDIKDYMSSIEKGGKKAILILDKWGIPDSIRTTLKNLYVSSNLEGAVFVGDIPVPMIRDAQHLTTAFKMDQKRDWKLSSIPSDRFYDDFDLKFDYIRQDKDKKLYYYYSLRTDSPQYICCDIYSARIKAPTIPGKDKYQAISEYLKKVVADKAQKRVMSKILHAAGHGYNSNSMNARVDEAWALKEQFPFLNTKSGSDLDFIDYTFDDFVKFRLMGALANPNLDLAILHHHGSEDEQLLNGSPIVSDANSWIELSKNFFRSKIRSAKDSVASKKYFVENYNIPPNWVEGVFNPKTIAEDSITEASQNIKIPDLYGYKSGAKIIIVDACFNGSFHLDDYISGHYIFNPGGTIVVKANSVNTLQDTWTNELMGLMNLGVCIGNWAKGQMTLESHLIGDPTFTFINAYPNLNLDRDIVKERSNVKYWKSLLGNALPDVKSLAMRNLLYNKTISSEELLKIQQTDKSAIVRLEAFMLIKKCADKNLPAAIILGLNDSYELLQRLSALTAAKNNAPELLPVLVYLKLQPTTSARVDFHLKDAIENYKPEDIKIEFDKTRAQQSYWPIEKDYNSLLKSAYNAFERETKDFEELSNAKATVKSKGFTISSQRNQCSAIFLDKLINVLKESNEPSLRLLTAETLGWYVYSYRKDYLVEKCKEQLAVEKDEKIKNELQKSINRLTSI